MSTASGGLGDLINNWNSLYYGIDRFQRAEKSAQFMLGLLKQMILLIGHMRLECTIMSTNRS